MNLARMTFCMIRCTPVAILLSILYPLNEVREAGYGGCHLLGVEVGVVRPQHSNCKWAEILVVKALVELLIVGGQ